MKHKGFSLVEVLVSIVILTISLGAILTCYLVTTNGYKKEREYLYFESICYDIDAHYDKFGVSWNEKYFTYNPTSQVHYYDEDFKEVNDIAARYKLSFEYINKELFITILNQKDNYNIIDKLNYGGPANV